MDDETPRSRGRPTRGEASAKAFSVLAAAGIDAGSVDPRIILQSIANDCSLPAAARVTACRLLMRDSQERELRAANEAELRRAGL